MPTELYDDDLPAAHEAEMTLNTLRSLPEGRYRMRVTEDDASSQFSPGFSFRHAGKLFVLFPAEEGNQRAMGVVTPPEAARAIILWRFHDAPEELRALSTCGGDEDWLAELPPSFNDDTPDWLYHLAANGNLLLYDHPTAPGWKVCIGAHA